MKNIQVDMYEPSDVPAADELALLGVKCESFFASPATDTLVFYNCSGLPKKLPKRFTVVDSQHNGSVH